MKHLPSRTTFDKIFHAKAFNIAKNPTYNGYKRGLAAMVYKSFDKKSASAYTLGGPIIQIQ